MERRSHVGCGGSPIQELNGAFGLRRSRLTHPPDGEGSATRSALDGADRAFARLCSLQYLIEGRAEKDRV
jgi:hypothetical protein